jgi:hypothetical protein
MNRRTVVLIAALIGACNSEPMRYMPGPVSITVPASVSAGAGANAVLINRSGATLHFGAIGCYVQTDRWEGHAWQSLGPRTALCIQPVYTLEDGKDFPFSFGTPSESGTYRLRTLVEGDTVLSGSFTVN